MLGLNYNISISELKKAANTRGKVYLPEKASSITKQAYNLFLENGIALSDCQQYADGVLSIQEEGRVGDTMVAVILEHMTKDISSAEDIVLKCDMRDN